MHSSVRLVRALATPVIAFLVATTPVHGAASYNMALLKNLNPYGGANDVWGYTSPGGTELAIYGHQTGTSFVDATNPANAVEVLNWPGPSSTWRDIKTYLNYAYVVTEGGGGGLEIFDLTDPLNPVHVKKYTGEGFDTAHNIWIDTGAGVAYLCGSTGGGMHILSLADPENPVQLDFFGSYYIHDLWVGGGIAYAGAISSGSLRIIDVSDPSNPFTIASHFYSGAVTHNAWPTANGLYCATTDETGGGHMKIWDVSNTANITLASEWAAGNGSGIIHNVLIKDDIAYISYYTRGTRVVDVTDPFNPVEIAYYDTSDVPNGFAGNWGVYPFRDDGVIYASDMQNGLFLLDFAGNFAGDILGVVTDAESGDPIEGATVDVDGGYLLLTTDDAGGYFGSIASETYQVVTSRFGYESDVSEVLIPGNGSVQHDVALTPVPNGAATLVLTEAASGNPVVGAAVEVLGTPIQGLLSDGTGEVTIPSLPIGTAWTARIGKFGRATTEVQVVTSEGTTTEIAVSMAPGFFDDFESDQGWIVGAPDDDATGGIWERALPHGSYWNGIVAPDDDASPTGEGWAYVTENYDGTAFVGVADVDDGKTTLLTPVFDGTGIGDLTLAYTRWFSNRAPSQDDDRFQVDLSTDGGSSWTNLETIDVGTDSWATVTIDLVPFGPMTSTMQIRFVAEDLDTETYVEAGLDDVDLLSTVTDVNVGEGRPAELRFATPSPNPFREGTLFSFDLPSSGPVSLEVYDVTGRRVSTLFRGDRVASGRHRVHWQGRDDAGRAVSPGVYFAKLVTVDGVESRKVTVLR